MSDSFWQGIRAGDRDAVEAWIGSHPEWPGSKAENGHSAVRMACDCGHRQLALWLLDAGAEVDAFDAAALGATDRVLADVDERPGLLEARSHDGMSLLHLAAFFGHRTLLEQLLHRGAPVTALSDNAMANTPLHAAIAGVAGDVLAPCLLDAGADPAAVGGGGVTPLHLAASRGSSELVERLLAAGARPAAMDDGRWPAELALERGFPELAARLRATGEG